MSRFISVLYGLQRRAVYGGDPGADKLHPARLEFIPRKRRFVAIPWRLDAPLPNLQALERKGVCK